MVFCHGSGCGDGNLWGYYAACDPHEMGNVYDSVVHGYENDVGVPGFPFPDDDYVRGTYLLYEMYSGHVSLCVEFR